MKEKIKNIIGWLFLSPFIIGVSWFLIKFALYLAMIGTFMFSMMIGGDTKLHYAYDFEIEAMKDNHTYVVSRYGGESNLEYHFIREMDGALHTGSTDAHESSIVEDGGSRVEVFVQVPEHFTSLNLKLSEWASWDKDAFSLLGKEYVYHVPEGSVETDEYNIDLE